MTVQVDSRLEIKEHTKRRLTSEEESTLLTQNLAGLHDYVIVVKYEDGNALVMYIHALSRLSTT